MQSIDSLNHLLSIHTLYINKINIENLFSSNIINKSFNGDACAAFKLNNHFGSVL